MSDGVKAIRYSDKYEAAWESLVEQSPNGTLFHTRRFLGYHPAGRFTDHSVLLFRNDLLLAVFPAAEIGGGESMRVLKSHPGSSYGGLATCTHLPLSDCVDLADALVNYARTQRFSSIEFRAAERIFHLKPAEQLDFALSRAGFTRSAEEIGTFFDIEDFWDRNDEEIIMLIPQKTRPPIRKGLANGMTFRQLTQDELPAWHAMLCRNLSRHGARATHSLEELSKLADLFPERIRAFGVFEGESLVSGLVVFEINPGRLHIFYSAMDYDRAKNNPLHFGVFKLFCWARDRRCKYLNYGISTEDRGRVINWGLLKFKESFGGLDTIRTSWLKDLSAI